MTICGERTGEPISISSASAAAPCSRLRSPPCRHRCLSPVAPGARRPEPRYYRWRRRRRHRLAFRVRLPGRRSRSLACRAVSSLPRVAGGVAVLLPTGEGTLRRMPAAGASEGVSGDTVGGGSEHPPHTCIFWGGKVFGTARVRTSNTPNREQKRQVVLSATMSTSMCRAGRPTPFLVKQHISLPRVCCSLQYRWTAFRGRSVAKVMNCLLHTCTAAPRHEDRDEDVQGGG